MSNHNENSKLFRFIWTFNGIGFALLLALTIPSMIAELRLFDINLFEEEQHETGLIVGTKAEKATDLKIDLQHLVYQRPSKIKDTDFYYTPIVVQDKDLPQDILDDIQTASDISIYMVGAPINILFFNESGTVVNKLLDENGFIEDYDIGSNYFGYRDDKLGMPYAIYKIAFSDDNGDSRINAEDNSPYFKSNLDGTNLTKITPDSLDLHIAWYSEDYDLIFFEEIIENKDKPLVYDNYFEKTRILYSYQVSTNEFTKFDLLQSEFESIQSEFSNSF